MKNLILVTLAIINSIVALTQACYDGQPQTEQQVIETLNKTEFIFEGEVIENIFFQTNNNTEHPKLYTSSKIRINKIVKGSNKIQLGTITLISEGGATEDGLVLDRSWYGAGSKGLFFCRTSNLPTVGEITWKYNVKDGYSQEVSSTTITPSVDNAIIIMPLQPVKYGNPINFGKNEVFKNKQELYNHLKKEGHPVIENKDKQPEKKNAGGSGAKTRKNQIKYEERVKNIQQFEQYLQVKIENNSQRANDACKEFFFSEYIDGPNAPNKNKVLEIYNPSDSVKSLNAYSIRIFNNGAPTPLNIPLSGNVNPKETYVVAHPNAHPDILAKADQTHVYMNFDGNDAIVLNKGTSTYVDKIGEIGVNPGNAGWNIPPGSSTKQHDLRRKYPIDKGETDWNQGKNQWAVLPNDSLANIKKHDNVCQAERAVEDVFYTFANPIETGTSPKYFEFDIMVEGGSNNTYLDNASFFIQYNTAAFGSNVVANNKITITKGANFNTSTYEDPNTVVQDDASNVFNFYLGLDYSQSSWNRTNATTSPQQLVHIKIEVANCNENTQLDFVNQSTSSNVSLYTDFPTADPFSDPFYNYDNTNYTNNMYEELCELKITNFTSPVYPGTWYQGTPTSEYLLTIQGNAFGAIRGNGNVYFKNANTGGQNFTLLNGEDFLSWTDNQIQIRMPSRIDTTLYSTTTTPIRVPGSGIFYVKTNSGDSVLSTTPIDMPYAIKNAGFLTGEKKVRMDLANVNNSDSTAITFRLDTSITNNPMVEAIVRKAVAKWRCETLVYFETGSDTTISTSTDDGVSVIHFTNSLDSGRIAETSIQPGSVIQCLDNNGNKHVFPSEIDIAFLRNPSQPWYFDTLGALPSGMNDFYEVALHEVGHGNLLQHVNAPSVVGNDDELMFWAALIDMGNSIPLANRRTIDLEAANGGFDVVQISNGLNINFGTCNATNVGTLFLSPDQSCGALVGFEELSTNNVEFSLYPNPTKDGFSLEYKLKRNATVQFRFIDSMGRVLKRFDLKKESTGQHKLFIETNNLTSGLYFLVATIDGKTQTFKVIKQ